ncbi:MAG TPA: 2-dehydropantoate 2-reductase [Hyphomicrobiales bacterium]|nr:2-dehydropantoate 2-reductase [Hyphomicrobiales bacterium]
MRTLTVGAGAIGGYFGARLLGSGRDVTFLVRPGRAESLARSGLIVRSRFGDIEIKDPPIRLAANLSEAFDLIILSCKAYDLDEAIASFAPAVGPGTTILPLLNGMQHLDALDRHFDPSHTVGGLCVISTTLDTEGRIIHLNDVHALAFGERDGTMTPRMERINAVMANANFDARLSSEIMQEMWEKWVFIASVAGINCLMRATIGDIVEAGGAALSERLLAECSAIAAANGFPLRPATLERNKKVLTSPGSAMMASMLRDVERGGRIEADHILGDLLSRSPSAKDALSLLHIAYTHLKAYEARRMREAG